MPNGDTFAHPAPGTIRTARFGDAGPRWTNEHTGVDYAAVQGTPVLATANGTVSFAGWQNDLYGNMVEIDHGSSIKSRYAHLSRFSTRVNDVVNQRDQIGLMGSTGNTTGSHVHFEIIFRGQHVDPETWIGRTAEGLPSGEGAFPDLLNIGQIENFFSRSGMFVGGVVVLLLAIYLTLKDRGIL